MPRIHPKFKDEKVCPICKCNFLGKVKSQTHCCNCAPIPVESEEIEDETGKTKKCKKCGEEFTPTAKANTICKSCK